jgi:hypothetical protein
LPGFFYLSDVTANLLSRRGGSIHGSNKGKRARAPVRKVILFSFISVGGHGLRSRNQFWFPNKRAFVQGVTILRR